jgi:vacuolar-type H+-ATPase subunit I/STV1
MSQQNEKVEITSLTERQKLNALANRFYNGIKWEPKKGDYYTTSRSDLELYQVVEVTDDKVKTTYLTPNSQISEWDKDKFLTEGFGANRVHVPNWVIEYLEETPSLQTALDQLRELREEVKTRNQLVGEAKAKREQIEKLKEEIAEINKQYMLLSDAEQWFTEEEETRTERVSRKKVEITELIGRINWTERFKDDDSDDFIDIDRSQVVRINGEWVV